MTVKEKAGTEPKAFKDWFDSSACNAMAAQVIAVYPGFNEALFKRHALKNIETLEFNDRVKQFSSALRQALPTPYPKAIGILVNSLPDDEITDGSINEGWLQWPIGQFIA